MKIKKIKLFGTSMAIMTALSSVPVSAVDFLSSQPNEFSESYKMKNTDEDFYLVTEYENQEDSLVKSENLSEKYEWLLTIGNKAEEDDSEFLKKTDDFAFTLGRLKPSESENEANEMLYKFIGKMVKFSKEALPIVFENDLTNVTDFYDQGWFRISPKTSPVTEALKTPDKPEMADEDNQKPYIVDYVTGLNIYPVMTETLFVTKDDFEKNSPEHSIYQLKSNQKDDLNYREKAQKVLSDFNSMTDEEKTFVDSKTNKTYKFTGNYKTFGTKDETAKDNFQSTTKLLDLLEFYDAMTTPVTEDKYEGWYFVFEVEETSTTESTVEEIPFETSYVKDDTLEEGKEVVVQEGVNGEKVDGKITKEPINKIVKQGTKKVQTTTTTEIPFEISYIEDTKMNYGDKVVIQKGVKGEKNANGEIVKEPTKEIVKVGTKEVIETSALKFETVYKLNKELKPFEEKVVQEGKDGIKTVTKTYELNTQTGEVKELIKVDEQKAVDKVVEVGEEIAKIKELPSTGVNKTATWVLVLAVIGVSLSGLAIFIKRKKNK